MTDHETTPIRIMLIDDHEIVRRGVADLLASEPDFEVVGEAGGYADAITRVVTLLPDVAVIDVRLPDGDGVELCREIRSQHPDIACLMLTSFSDDDALFSAILAGASGYVLKQIRGQDLVSAIRDVAAGRSLLDPALTARVLDRLRNPPVTDPRLASLTEQERRVLELIAGGLTNRQIGAEMFLAEKTVKNYVSAVLSKLGMQRRTQAAVYGAQVVQRRAASED